MDIDITEILRAIAEGKQNDMGDYWSPSWCKNAAEHIEALRARVSALEAELKALEEQEPVCVIDVKHGDGVLIAGSLDRGTHKLYARPLPQVPAVRDGYVLMELGIRPYYQTDAAVRDFRLMRQVGAKEEQCIAAAIEAALLAAAQKEGKS